MAFDMSAFQNAAAAGEVKEKASGASIQHTTTVLPAGVPDLCLTSARRSWTPTGSSRTWPA